ncbi:hypothetical protein Hanom_Chr09g00840181 [Helianthus anomalus]
MKWVVIRSGKRLKLTCGVKSLSDDEQGFSARSSGTTAMGGRVVVSGMPIFWPKSMIPGSVMVGQ